MRKYVFKKRWKRVLAAVFDAAGVFLYAPFKLFGKKPGSADKILVARLDQAGDMVQALPFLDALRRKYPGARITVFCARETEFLARSSPAVDETISFESSWFYPEKRFSLKEAASVLKKMRREKYGFAFDLRGDARNIFFLKLAGASRITGYGCAGGGFFLDGEKEYDREEHEIDKNLKLIGEKAPDVMRMNFHTGEKEREEAAKFLEGAGKKRIVIHPFTRARSKMWGINKFGVLAGMIADAAKDAAIFIIGGREDGAGATAFEKIKNVRVCAGKTGFGASVEIIKQSSVFVGCDSGPQYFAAYSGVKTCVIYGYTSNSARWRPKVEAENFIGITAPVDCGPCELDECAQSSHRCMEMITPEAVFGKIEPWLKGPG
ncbi:MAG TPA: lipopolysaccharide heptosyltransferase family protein [bacterium]|nr:lipopolysaccharide heptosyltransferase family protein [bacterium]